LIAAEIRSGIGVVTRAVCDVVAGNALYRAALGEEDGDVLDRALGDAAGWIRGRAGAAGLDPARDLGPMLRVLAVAHTSRRPGYWSERR